MGSGFFRCHDQGKGFQGEHSDQVFRKAHRTEGKRPVNAQTAGNYGSMKRYNDLTVDERGRASGRIHQRRYVAAW